MKRRLLTQIVSSAAAGCGYAFHTGEEHLIPSSVRTWPAAWLTPPTVHNHTGREEGETTFAVNIHLMALPGGDTETVWQAMEADALAIATAVARSEAVLAVTDIRCTPQKQSLTPHGESSVTLSCRVTMWYINDPQP